jgi:hypothetical protein
MKYAIQTEMRFNTVEERDAVVDSLKLKLKKTYDLDESYIKTHKCFHDEDINKPCEIEETIKPVVEVKK